MAYAVQISGLRDFQASIRAVDRTLPRELRKANLEAATVVADATKQSFAGRPGSAPLVVPTIKAAAEQRSAGVKVGSGNSKGSKVAMGNLWGSKAFPQFPRPVPGGYSLYPSLRAKQGEVLDVYGKAIDRVAHQAFPGRFS